MLRKRGETTRAEIVRVAREQINDSGSARTSVSAITKQAGVSRSLFYHYFKNLDEVLGAVLEDVIDDFIAELQKWNEQRKRGDVAGSLESAARLMRRLIAEDAKFSTGLLTGPNSSLCVLFMERMSRQISEYIAQTTVQDFAAHHEVKIDHVENTFYVLISGMVSLIKTNPEISHEEVVRIAAQTLHLEEFLPEAD
ncbi:MAG: TetR/AcrR family transcriptional regulator [Trueperella sp.]|nr:TetR/AcrR family transcriptional regulator [Trueperella sp.]